MRKLSYLILIAFCASLYNCANVIPPKGGPEDMAPPKLLKSTPSNNSTNFTGSEIKLEFDEFVDAQKLRENLLISPLTNSNYEVITNKKNVLIKFIEPFSPNTTYSIFFGESVKDLTKGNYNNNLSLAFSTGPFIDTLSISGSVFDYLTNQPVKDIAIQLYSNTDTANIKTSKPLYYGKTDILGSFKIKNIKEGEYSIYALQDINNNYKYDNHKEKIAFQKKLIISQNIKGIKLGLTTIDTKAPELIGSKQEQDYYLLTFSEGIQNYTIQYDSLSTLIDITEDKKQLKIFNNFKQKDSIQLKYSISDSAGNISSNSIKILFEEVKQKNKKTSLSQTTTPTNLQLSKNDSITLKFNQPIQTINYQSIELKTDTTRYLLTEKDIKIYNNNLNINIIYKKLPKDSLLLTLNKGSIISINNDTLTNTKLKFKNKKEEEYGILSGKIICSEPNYIFQLVLKNKVLDTKYNATKFHYTFLEPGEYKLKLIIDVNNNGKWDAADLENDIAPEPIYYYKEKINLRANWDLLDLKFEPQK